MNGLKFYWKTFGRLVRFGSHCACAIELARTSPFGVTRSNALRRAKARAQQDWVREWRNETKTGRYAIANRFEPRLKPTKRFTLLGREIFGRVIQCRTGHAFTGEYREQFHPLKDTNCPCGEEPRQQTREHILRECLMYEPHREILREVSRDISLPEILGIKEGVEALGTFIEKSGAFTPSGQPRQTPEADIQDYTDVAGRCRT
ncbi:hypothetical protein L218DRAFT_1050689 [Marasmius fiardii PR-910]|nr:hypothetical protein L218DRAFT_1050689 [Marasmius fiardii PR-910]